jgi:hypothetical protein
MDTMENKCKKCRHNEEPGFCNNAELIKISYPNSFNGAFIYCIEDIETIRELRDLMIDTKDGLYFPDSFTTQPIDKLLERLESPKQ